MDDTPPAELGPAAPGGSGQRPEPGQLCPLCRSGCTRPFAKIRAREYFECALCRLVFLKPSQRLSPEVERAHYGTHRNDPTDPGYRAFLGRLATPLAKRLPAGAEGLDYGCGPGPTLSRMLEEQGFPTAIYDPFFAPDAGVLRRTYDFITCTEAVEHFFSPAAEFNRVDGMLRPGGWFGVMTEMLDAERVFSGWRYARDPTHVCFYRANTMEWTAAHFGWTLELVHRNAALFRKPRAE